MQLKRVLRKIRSIPWFMLGKASISYSQYGEDIIIVKLLERLQIKSITYLDIGANDPILGNNTYAFYQRGFSGVLIEPNPVLYKKIKQTRAKDVVLNIGISNEAQTEADYYMFNDSHNPLNTFSREDALSCESQGIMIRETIKIPLKNINDILDQYFKQEAPTLVSIDVEGLDELILRALDYERKKPLLICVETAIFSLNGAYAKRQSIINFVISKGYFVYADTHANTIFCHEATYHSLLKQIE